MLMTLIVSVALCGAPKADPRLVGTWLAGNEPFMTLAANGSGTMDDDKVKWSTEGSTLSITDDEGETDKATFQVNGDAMTITINGMPIALTRARGDAAVKAKGALAAKAEKMKGKKDDDDDDDKEALAMAQAWLEKNGQGGQQQLERNQPRAQPQGQGNAAGNDQLSQLLLSSAWCSFSYNKISGTTKQTRVQYFRNGTWAVGGQTETYNSGANGTVAGQYNNNNGGLWEVRNGQLWGSYGNAPLQLVQPFSVTRNSNGYPIINSLGVEYSMCN